jgi:hypothetical protein
MKIIKKAVKLSFDRFVPNQYQRRYHFAIAFDGNTPILLSQNNPIKVNSKAYRIGQQFNIKTYIDFPYVHAESHLVSKLLDRYNTIDPNWSMVVLRINRQGKILLSKPCDNCQKILDAVGFTKVFWSINEQNFSSNNHQYINV